MYTGFTLSFQLQYISVSLTTAKYCSSGVVCQQYYHPQNLKYTRWLEAKKKHNEL